MADARAVDELMEIKKLLQQILAELKSRNGGAILAEREACEKIAESYYVPCMECTEEDALVSIIAEAIRARK